MTNRASDTRGWEKLEVANFSGEIDRRWKGQFVLPPTSPEAQRTEVVISAHESA